MRDEQYKKIDDTNYVCKPLPGWDGVGLFFNLIDVIGEPAMMMITRSFAEDEVEADAGQVVGAGLYAFLAKLSADKGVAIMKQVFADVSFVNAKEERVPLVNEADFNLHFKGETLAALRVFVWALQVNFQSFLDASRLTGILGKLQAAASKAVKTAGPAEVAEETSPQSSTSSSSTPTEAQI